MTAAAPKITIVIGVLNGARTLEHCIDSIAAQTLGTGVELVIKDGGSSDGTLEILERRSKDIAYWTSKPDTGLYDAWNQVLPHCRGRWIGFLGCDDELAHRTVLERLIESVPDEDPPDLVCSLNAFVDDQGKFIKITGRPFGFESLKLGPAFAHACLLHRADLFTKLGGFDTSYKIGADYEWLLRLGPDMRTHFVDQVTVRVGSNGMSHRKWRTTYAEHYRLQAKHPSIGPARASKNYTRNVAWYLTRKLLGRR